MVEASADLERLEYDALRDTIRERGTARVILFLAAMGIWGAIVVATAAVLTIPVASLIPLVVLGAGFEAVAALHIGVERVGRYVQVRYEGDPGSAEAIPTMWEQTSMAWGARFPGTGTDPLFATSFYLAIIINYLPAALTGLASELLLLALAHAALAWRISRVRSWAGRQRAEDLERFRSLLGPRGSAARTTPASPPTAR